MRSSLATWKAIAAAKEAAQGEDTADIEAKTQSLVELLHRFSEKVYEKASQTQATGSENGAGEEPVEDAEYEIIDADEKAS